MATKGVGVYGINSVFASGALIFYEKEVGRTATGDVFTVGTDAVKVGGTSQDVDFQWYSTGSLSALLDCGAATLTLTGITQVFSAGGISLGTTSTLILPVKATGAATKGNLWYDTDDNYIHFYGNAAEVKITGCVYA